MEEVPAGASGSRRHEDIALDLMKFVAMTTGYGRTSSSGVGFQGSGAASKPEEYASHLLELYSKCLHAVTKESSSSRAISVTCSTARPNATSLAFEGWVKPLNFRTNCRAEARISSSVAQPLSVSLYLRKMCPRRKMCHPDFE